jgi:hypothetical protein
VQEPFCKLASFFISEVPPFPDLCSFFATTPDTHPDALMKYLCRMGMTATLASQVLVLLARKAEELGRALSDDEFAAVVSAVFGQDAVPAFRSAGILP